MGRDGSRQLGARGHTHTHAHTQSLVRFRSARRAGGFRVPALRVRNPSGRLGKVGAGSAAAGPGHVAGFGNKGDGIQGKTRAVCEEGGRVCYTRGRQAANVSTVPTQPGLRRCVPKLNVYARCSQREWHAGGDTTHTAAMATPTYGKRKEKRQMPSFHIASALASGA